MERTVVWQYRSTCSTYLLPLTATHNLPLSQPQHPYRSGSPSEPRYQSQRILVTCICIQSASSSDLYPSTLPLDATARFRSTQSRNVIRRGRHRIQHMDYDKRRVWQRTFPQHFQQRQYREHMGSEGTLSAACTGCASDRGMADVRTIRSVWCASRNGQWSWANGEWLGSNR